MPRKFDLNIEKVLENWEVCHAIREIIANALDEQLLSKTETIHITKENTSWHVRDFGRGLKYNHLTQNENEEKLKSSDQMIGKFGVGLKDALATFDRKNIEVLIKSKHGDIAIEKASKHNFETITTLHAVISDPSEPTFVGTDFTLKGVSDDDIEIAKSYFLQFSKEYVLETTRYGQVLKGKESTATPIYINGLKVAEEENFLFSYNITSLTKPMKKALNRERTNVGRTAYTDRVKSILLECKNNEVGIFLMQDLQKFENGRSHDELKWVDIASHAVRILSSSQKVIFMTSDELISKPDTADDAKREGYQIVSIPNNVKQKISGTLDIKGNPINDTREFSTQKNNSYEFNFINPAYLTNEEKNVFSKTKSILDLIGGQPSNVKEILISETMRLQEDGQATIGLWQKDQQRIIIKRSELIKLSEYAGTLLHEIGHALSDAPDVSRHFECELSNLLGLVAEQAIALLQPNATHQSANESVMDHTTFDKSSKEQIVLNTPSVYSTGSPTFFGKTAHKRGLPFPDPNNNNNNNKRFRAPE